MMLKETSLIPDSIPGQKVRKQSDALLKAAFEDCFQDLLRFFYLDADQLFDMSKGFEFMDKELREIHPQRIQTGGTRLADLLVKVYLFSGKPQWFLIHLEIQERDSRAFPFRMFEYYYRLVDRFKVPVVAMAVFTGAKHQSPSSEYRFSLLGTEVLYRYKTYQIFDHTEKELLDMDNPFALVVLAARKALLENKVSEEVLAIERNQIARAMLASKKYDHERILGFMNFLKNLIYIKDSSLNREFDENVTELTKKKIRMSRVMELLAREAREEAMILLKDVARIEAKKEVWIEAKIEARIEAKKEVWIEARIEAKKEARIEAKKGVKEEVKAQVVLAKERVKKDLIKEIVQKMKQQGFSLAQIEGLMAEFSLII